MSKKGIITPPSQTNNPFGIISLSLSRQSRQIENEGKSKYSLIKIRCDNTDWLLITWLFTHTSFWFCDLALKSFITSFSLLNTGIFPLLGGRASLRPSDPVFISWAEDVPLDLLYIVLTQRLKWRNSMLLILFFSRK